MPRREFAFEPVHEVGFLAALDVALPHARVQEVDHPVVRDRQMACERHSVDYRDPIFSIEVVRAAIVHKAGQIILRYRISGHIVLDFGDRLQFLQTLPAM